MTTQDTGEGPVRHVRFFWLAERPDAPLVGRWGSLARFVR
jgi:hypothetical protein